MGTILFRVNECKIKRNDTLILRDLNLESLPDLSNFIKILDCSGNRITKLPDNMPDSLQRIYCSNNQITKLPDKMSDSLQIIYCSHNQITKLPDKMSDSLQEIYCSHN